MTVTVNPGSRNIELTAEQEGIFRIFRDAGPVKRNWSVCGPCVGMGDSPPEGVLSVRTFNRNFPGRSGTPKDRIALASPATAAACAVRGVITDPRDHILLSDKAAQRSLSFSPPTIDY